MTADIIPFGGVTRLDLNPDQVLDGAKGELSSVLIIGFDKEGELYCAASASDGGEILWLLEACKRELMEGDEP